ncbi:hypothetical protein [Rhizobium sp. BK176]|uniref:hypothetical protein n=1 Tax=Rhizobium sp. BK176 TaxID=2587071 RepID=UPI002167B668|nr:hypothetical protein [Rhizobium sp. BK176]MCS4088831.1 hypothetical protein [Rhizobium sp. BK176]
MFTYVFYIGGMAIVAAVMCSILFMGYRAAPGWVRGRFGAVILATLCCATMILMPYAGWSHATRSKSITARNNEFASLEAEIAKKDFNSLCTFNGFMAGAKTPSANSFPCIQRADIRIVSNPYRGGLAYFVIDRAGLPERWRGMVDYPIPFSFPQDRKLLDPERIRATFLTGDDIDAPQAPVTAAE